MRERNFPSDDVKLICSSIRFDSDGNAADSPERGFLIVFLLDASNCCCRLLTRWMFSSFNSGLLAELVQALKNSSLLCFASSNRKFFFISRFAQKLYCWAVWKILSLKLLNYNAGCTKHWSGVGGWSKYLDLTNDHNKFWIFFSKVENFSRVLSLPQHYFFVCDFLANHHSRMFLFNCTRHKRRRELTPEQL